jgi:hypothetical protein
MPRRSTAARMRANQGRWPPIIVGNGPRHVGAIRARRSIVPGLDAACCKA